jgi:hypothetical protein
MESFGSGGGRRCRSLAAVAMEREEKKEREERRRKRWGSQNGIDGRAPTSLVSYYIRRAPTTLAPLCPSGTSPEYRWIPRAPLSLASYCAPSAPGCLAPYASVRNGNCFPRVNL